MSLMKYKYQHAKRLRVSCEEPTIAKHTGPTGTYNQGQQQTLQQVLRTAKVLEQYLQTLKSSVKSVNVPQYWEQFLFPPAFLISYLRAHQSGFQGNKHMSLSHIYKKPFSVKKCGIKKNQALLGPPVFSAQIYGIQVRIEIFMNSVHMYVVQSLT